MEFLRSTTIYGYVLRRLRELQLAPDPIKRQSERLITSLGAKIWTCAEGSATAIEAVTVKSTRSSTTFEAFRESLTSDYLEALAVYKPLCDYSIPFPEPLDIMARSALITAVAECASVVSNK